MNIPYWLLRLLPIFECICPKCRKGVKQSARQCPHCGEKYPLALRVPPTFLKDPKKLEAYVHEHIFPRISEFERNYLTKYFTVLFSDGFESGDFSAWTGTDNAPIVQSTIKHHGTYAMKIDAAGEFAYKLLDTAKNNLFMRMYWQADATPANGNQTGMLSFYESDAVTERLQVRVWNNGGTITWILAISGTSYTYTSGSCNPNQWYCIEAEYDSVSDVHNLWLDGVNVISQVDTETGTVQYVIADSAIGFFGTAQYIDCVVVADAYIGPEAAGVTVKKGSNLSGLMTEMLNSKMLYSAINRFPKLSPRTL